jgi:hypothetical protein
MESPPDSPGSPGVDAFADYEMHAADKHEYEIRRLRTSKWILNTFTLLAMAGVLMYFMYFYVKGCRYDSLDTLSDVEFDEWSTSV